MSVRLKKIGNCKSVYTVEKILSWCSIFVVFLWSAKRGRLFNARLSKLLTPFIKNNNHLDYLSHSSVHGPYFWWSHCAHQLHVVLLFIWLSFYRDLSCTPNDTVHESISPQIYLNIWSAGPDFFLFVFS